MDILKTVLWSLGGVYLLILLIVAFKTAKPLKTVLIGVALGVAALAAVDLTSRFTGVYIPINPRTVGGSAAFGIPGVITFLIMKTIL